MTLNNGGRNAPTKKENKMNTKIKIGMNESELSLLLERFCNKHGYEHQCAAELKADLEWKNDREYQNSNEKLDRHCTWLEIFINAWDVALGE